jgi:hypothetical protein
MSADGDAWDDVVLGGILLVPVLLGWLLYYLLVRRRASPNVRWSRLLLGNTLVFLLLCSVGLLAGEVYYRYFLDTTQDYRSKLSGRWFKRHWKLNSWDLRDTEDYAVERKPGKRRVTFLGDSMTAGQGVKVHQRFANLYRARKPDQDVHVLAQVGWDTVHHVTALLECIRNGYQFDLVVLCYYLNDNSDLIPEIAAGIKKSAMPGFLFQHSYFLNTLYWRFSVAHDPFCQNYNNVVLRHYQGPTWDIQKQRLKELRRLVLLQKARLAVVTFPVLDYSRDPRALAVHKQLRDFWKEEGVPNLDLLRTFKSYPTQDLVVNKYDSHPSASAHALAADAIIDFLDQLGWPGPG